MSTLGTVPGVRVSEDLLLLDLCSEVATSREDIRLEDKLICKI